jgi:hypothetical protein
VGVVALTFLLLSAYEFSIVVQSIDALLVVAARKRKSPWLLVGCFMLKCCAKKEKQMTALTTQDALVRAEKRPISRAIHMARSST